MKKINLFKTVISIMLALTLLAGLPLYAFAEESGADGASDVSADTGSEGASDGSEEQSDAVSSAESGEEPSDEPSEEPSEESSEEPSEEPSEPGYSCIFVTVPDVRPGNITLSGWVSREREGDATVYEFSGKSATFTVTYEPEDGCSLWGIYKDDEFYEAYNGKSITFTVYDDCVLEPIVSGYPTVRGEVMFEGSDEAGIYITVDGSRFERRSYIKGYSTEVRAVLPLGMKAEKAVFTFADGSESVTVDFVDNACVFPAVNGDFTVTVTVSGKALSAVRVTYDGSGSVSADCGDSIVRGGTAVFTVTPGEGMYVESATLNGRLVSVINGTYIAVASTDLVFHVVFAEKPAAQTVTISVDSRASGGRIAFAAYEGMAAEVPYGEDCEIIFTPDEGYVLDRVYINGISTTPLENRLVVNVNRAYDIVATFRKATYKITAVVAKSYGGTLEAVGYTMTNGIVSVDHGGSVTFRFTPDMGHVVSAVRIDGASLEGELSNEFTFTNVTANHTLTVSFAVEGENVKYHTVTVDCGDHGRVEPSNRIEVDDGDDIVISFIPDEGYEIDRVYYDGQQATLTQGKLVLVNVTGDHIIQVSFREKPEDKPDWITADDINWAQSDITIDVSRNTKVGKDVFLKIQSLESGRRVTFTNGLFDITVTGGSSAKVSGDFADLAYDTMIAPESSEVFLQCLGENGIKSLYTVVVVPDAYPTGSVMSITLGGGFSAKTVDCYAFDGSVLAKKNGGVVADLNGKVTIPLYDVRTVVIAIDSTAPVNHIVTVNCGANGTADPMNSQPVADGGGITVRIFPFDGYMVDSVTVDGVALTLDEKARLSGACELPLSNIRKDTTVEIKFTVMPVEENSGIGLVFVVVIISVALVGGGVLFFIQWKRMKY